MYCVKCGTNLPDDAKFCPKCGRPVETEIYEEPSMDIEEKIQMSSNSNQVTSVSLSDDDVVDAICPRCGFNGKMRIVERNNISVGNKIILYVVCYGGLFLLAYILDLILVPLFPTWVLYIFGFIMCGIVFRKIRSFIKREYIKRFVCPQCKAILEFKQR